MFNDINLHINQILILKNLNFPTTRPARLAYISHIPIYSPVYFFCFRINSTVWVVRGPKWETLSLMMILCDHWLNRVCGAPSIAMISCGENHSFENFHEFMIVTTVVASVMDLPNMSASSGVTWYDGGINIKILRIKLIYEKLVANVCDLCITYFASCNPWFICWILPLALCFQLQLLTTHSFWLVLIPNSLSLQSQNLLFHQQFHACDVHKATIGVS